MTKQKSCSNKVTQIGECLVNKKGSSPVHKRKAFPSKQKESSRVNKRKALYDQTKICLKPSYQIGEWLVNIRKAQQYTKEKTPSQLTERPQLETGGCLVHKRQAPLVNKRKALYDQPFFCTKLPK